MSNVGAAMIAVGLGLTPVLVLTAGVWRRGGLPALREGAIALVSLAIASLAVAAVVASLSLGASARAVGVVLPVVSGVSALLAYREAVREGSRLRGRLLLAVAAFGLCVAFAGYLVK